MKKNFLLLTILMALICSRCSKCFYEDGDVVEVPFRVLDVDSLPIEGVTLTLIQSDSFQGLIKNPRIEQQKKTDKNGNVNFTLIHDSKVQRFFVGEDIGTKRSLNDFQYSNSTRKWTNIFIYDDTTIVKIRFVSQLANMQKGIVRLQSQDRILRNREASEKVFAITGDKIDTTFSFSAFKKIRLTASADLQLKDSVRFKGFDIKLKAQRDSVIVFNFQ